ncbi:hypothetical protein [Flammeovirga sp. EKP202]|uniref:hypothetical protein n=1 Tax=Flammeovirga sp. EKP202 TaxID=2770592 RepID=UPI00165FBD36|nr:hypothetical protein [Flammeovirga sp. EKP202]MBD0404641.1 hypothetical protein [Flammeovirga sp. EKP202]
MKKVIIKWNSILIVYIVVLYGTISVSNAQSCTIIEEEMNDFSLQYLDLNKVDLNHKFMMTLLTINGMGRKSYTLYSQGEQCFFEVKIEEEQVVFTSTVNCIFDTIDSLKENHVIYEICSSNFERHYFDAMLIKAGSQVEYFIPIGSSIFGNIECISSKSELFSKLIKKFQKEYLLNRNKY